MELRALVFQWQRSKVKKAWIFQDIFGILRIFRFFTKLDQNIIFRTVCDLWMQRNIYDVSKHGIKRAFQQSPPSSSHVFQAFHEIKNRWVLWKKNSGTEEYHLKCWQWASKPYLKCNPWAEWKKSELTLSTSLGLNSNRVKEQTIQTLLPQKPSWSSWISLFSKRLSFSEEK